MLKDTEYEAIGRLALAFNEVETVIDEYCPHMLGASKWEVATILWDKKASVVTSKLAIEGHFKTGHRAAART
jgi:hypothetical protein